ncbi:MAG: hypothetical protein H5U40_11500, partial [Polyangiaceae bacterium]|nr:hypothetical protein [Polyangiaceae bacterium]
MLGLVPDVLRLQGLMQPLFGPAETFVASTGIAVTVLATLWFVAAFFERPAPHRAWLVVSGTIPLTSLFWPRYPESIYVASALVGLVFAFGVSSQLRMLFGLARAGAAGARLWLACWLVLAVTSVPDVILSAGGPDVASGFRTSMLGILAFCCFFAYLTTEGDALRLLSARAELDRRVEDLVRARDAAARVTKSLQSGVIARSTRLYTALATLANHHTTATTKVGDRIGEDLVLVRVVDPDDRVYEAKRGESGERYEVVVFSGVRGSRLAVAARLLARLSDVAHPAVTRPVDVDVAREGFLYAVFPRAVGLRLDDERLGLGSFDERIRLVAGVAEALAALHDAGVVHGAVTSSNVFVDVDPARTATTTLSRIDLG